MRLSRMNGCKAAPQNELVEVVSCQLPDEWPAVERRSRAWTKMSSRRNCDLAARIEKLNKQFDSRLLIPEIVWQAVSSDGGQAVPMGQVEVRGREQAIQIYQVA